jgi:hypothetical protein
MSGGAFLKRGGIRLRISATFFGVCGLLTALLSLAPGAHPVLWVGLRTASVILVVAAVGTGARQAWATIPGLVAAGLGVLTGLVLIALVPTFIFPEALASFAVALLAGSSLALYSVLREMRRQSRRGSFGEEVATLESRRFLITAALVTPCIFVVIPLLAAVVWFLFGCTGKISGALCA